jgi:hypothetical protein
MSAESLGATTESATPEADAESKVESPGAESPPAADADASENQKAKSGFSERIDELTRLRREAERDRDYYRDLALRTQTREEPAPREAPREQPVELQPELKTLADFNYDERAYGKYMLAEATKAARSEADKLRQELRESRTAEDRQYAVTEFQERAEKWAKTEKIEDFDIAFRHPKDGGPMISDEMGEAIIASENGAALLYHLAKNRQLAAQIARLPAALQTYEIGKLEAKLAKPVTNKVSEAPPPAPRIDGSGASAVNVKPDDPASDKLTDEEWTRLRNKQEAARRARRAAQH